MNEIDWHIVNRLLIDAPTYDSKDTEKKKNTFDLSEESSEELINKLAQNVK